MNEPAAPVEVALRIPGTWSHPQELIQGLPSGFHGSAEGLVLPDATWVKLGAMGADDQFAGIFRSACRSPASDDELRRSTATR